jgi:ankyrin repeat protein
MVGHVHVINLLLQAGAVTEINIQTVDDGSTPLHQSCCNDHHLESAAVLLQDGADIHARDRWGQTPLHDAAQAGQCQLISFLFQSGADCTATNHVSLSLSLSLSLPVSLLSLSLSSPLLSPPYVDIER